MLNKVTLCALKQEGSVIVIVTSKIIMNPFTARACTISGLKSVLTSLQNSTVSGPITDLFSVLCIMTDILSCQCETANKKTSRCQIPHFYWPFSSDMAVKGLKLRPFNVLIDAVSSLEI